MTPSREHAPILALRDDPTVPAVVRSTITDWWQRFENGRRILAELRGELEAAKVAERQARKVAPDRVVAMLAAGKVTPDRIAPELEQLRAAVRVADDRVQATSTAVRRCESLLGSCFESAGRDMVPWIAAHRVEVGRWGKVPVPVVTAWKVVRGSARVSLPMEAWQQRQGDVTVLVRPDPWPGLDPGRRDWWAWNMVHQGNYAISADGPVTVFTITSPWPGDHLGELEQPLRQAIRGRR